jgi:hypothetical protein
LFTAEVERRFLENQTVIHHTERKLFAGTRVKTLPASWRRVSSRATAFPSCHSYNRALTSDAGSGPATIRADMPTRYSRQSPALISALVLDRGRTLA